MVLMLMEQQSLMSMTMRPLTSITHEVAILIPLFYSANGTITMKTEPAETMTMMMDSQTLPNRLIRQKSTS